MRSPSLLCSIYAALILLLFSATAFAINAFFYQYPGNSYLPPFTTFIAVALLLVYTGACLQFGINSKIPQILKEVIYFFLLILIISIATNAVQYTPFKPIDQYLVYFEEMFYIDFKAIITWTHANSNLKTIMGYIYNSLVQQMVFIPLLVIIAMRFRLMHEYYFLMLSSALIGFVFYYFFPTTGPASVIDSPYFYEVQKATGLKFHQIHNYIQPTTIEGGMIALPSFHIIWAWFCVYILKEWKIAFFILLFFNIGLTASCVLLGWHYPVDIIGSVLVIIISHSLYFFCRRSIRACREW